MVNYNLYFVATVLLPKPAGLIPKLFIYSKISFSISVFLFWRKLNKTFFHMKFGNPLGLFYS